VATHRELFYGHSLKGKSRAITELVIREYEKRGRKSRLYIGDGGVATYVNAGLVNAGMLEICDFSWRPFPLPTLKAMSMFWWPDEHGKWHAPSKEFLAGETHGLVIYEGATIIKQWLMGNNEGAISDKISKGEKIGGVKDEADSLVMFDGKVNGLPDSFSKSGNITGLHYGPAYRQIESAIQRTEAFPGMVIWTAHPTEAPDIPEGGRQSGIAGKVVGKKVIGPDVVAKSRASTITALFGNTLHFDTAKKKAERNIDNTTGKNVNLLEPEYRVYTRSHFDPDGLETIEYRAGSRVDGLDLYYTADKPGEAILKFYDTLGKLEAQRDERFKKIDV